MRKILCFATFAILAAPAVSWCRQGQTPQQNQSQSSAPQAQSAAPAQASVPSGSSQSSSNSQAGQATTGAPQQESLADAARKSREQKKQSAKTAKVFTNDNIPTSGGISSVGSSSEAAPADDQAAGASANAPTGAKAGGSDAEKQWRDKFAALRSQLAKDQAELDVLQRELNVDSLQYYGGDPNKAYQDQTSMQPMGAEYTRKREEIDAKQKQIAADEQAISDAEDDLRKSGGDPGWAR
jgi:chromosome segregation ATPase